MSRFEWNTKAVRMAVGLGYLMGSWDPKHASWGATCQDRMQFTPEGWIMALGPTAAEALYDQLSAESRAEQAADIDPELSRVTPRVPVAAIYRGDCPTCHGLPLGEIGCVACPTCGTQYGGC